MADLSTSIVDFFNEVYLPQSTKLTKPRAIEAFRCELSNFDKYFAYRCAERGERLRKPELGDLSDETLSGAMRWQLNRSRTKSRPTANKLYAAIRAIWQKAFDDRILNVLPRVKKFDVPKRERRTWTPAEFQKILDQAQKLNYFVGEIPAAQWWTAFLWTAANTATRLNALMHLTPESIDWERLTITVPAELQKHDMDQTFDLSVQCVAALRAINPKGRARIFCWSFDETEPDKWQTLRRHYRRYLLKPAGLRHSSKDLFHSLRAMVATWITADEGDRGEAAQRYLGHSHVSVTRVYLDQTQLKTRTKPNHLLRLFAEPQVELGPGEQSPAAG